ncbi:hypothetical protein AVEN_144585-1 [Araneus ventricosus]|uniref:Uncharacterized protein n=1 Tax=Araneus ventricosus TaxID=182803 RepID=A0A4Y2C0L4_ARAVE|nr:hypothetical protein AVEN_144585-1 [Araneus ventricosus]
MPLGFPALLQWQFRNRLSCEIFEKLITSSPKLANVQYSVTQKRRQRAKNQSCRAISSKMLLAICHNSQMESIAFIAKGDLHPLRNAQKSVASSVFSGIHT